VTTKIADEILSLPMFPELTEEQVARVCAAIAEFHGG
jgi:dTDP-4-amino-4,6-dideoxygalactose transaminase